MALIQKGSFDDFSARAAASEIEDVPALSGLETISTLREATRDVQPVPIEFIQADSPRGLALKSVTLKRGFEGILSNVFNSTNEVYFMAWAWDLSGAPIVQYPGDRATPQDVIIPLEAGQIRQFLGA